MVLAKQERTGKLSFLKELREREWHPSIIEIARQQLGEEWARQRLEPYYKALELYDSELRMLCQVAKNNFDLKHRDEGIVLYWSYRACGNPNCRTCYGKFKIHFPYPTLNKALNGNPSSPPSYYEKSFREARVRREVLARFLLEECELLESQVAYFLDLMDLRTLMIRRYNYEVEEYRNLGVIE